MGSFEGMRDRPRSRGFRPALCNEGTTEHCVVRGLECIRFVARVVPSAGGLSRLLLCVFVG